MKKGNRRYDGIRRAGFFSSKVSKVSMEGGRVSQLALPHPSKGCTLKYDETKHFPISL